MNSLETEADDEYLVPNHPHSNFSVRKNTNKIRLAEMQKNYLRQKADVYMQMLEYSPSNLGYVGIRPYVKDDVVVIETEGPQARAKVDKSG